MYRMVFMDIDGTLLTSEGRLDPELVQTVQKLKSKGVLFGLATGRSFIGSKLYGEQFGCSLYVSYQGALVHDDSQIIYDHCIPGDAAYKLCSKTYEWGRSYVHFSGDTSRSNNPSDHVEHLLPYAALCDISDTNKDAHRITLSLDMEQIAEMEADISGTYYFVEDGRLEIYPPGSKWHGIVPLMDKYGIAPNEVVTIGNGVNDIEMLEGAGLGIAMGNASERVKKAADWITMDHNHQGVTHALKKVFSL